MVKGTFTYTTTLQQYTMLFPVVQNALEAKGKVIT